ncbi:MAG: YfhO family protein [Elusimicrobia bacterium]|nr:YfhO family protein [Elusimicrobiota bacterium]MBD3412612.1 YfhO family protein [Elusimicrobiota bacterium]
MHRIKKYWPIVVLGVITAVFFWKPLTLQGIFFTSDPWGNDLMRQNLPLRHLLAEALRSFSVPVWSDLVYHGYPVLAEGEGGFLFPLNWLLFGMLPLTAAYNYATIINFFSGALFVFLLMRTFNASHSAALVSGISYGFSGYMLVNISHIIHSTVIAMMPFMFFLFERYHQTKKKHWIMAQGIYLGLMILAGFPQLVYYSMLGLAWYGLVRLASRKESLSILNKAKAIFFYFGTVTLIGLGISMAQWLPSLELSSRTIRAGGMMYEYATSNIYSFRDLATFIIPFIDGDPSMNTYTGFSEKRIFWENCSYMGILIIPLFIIGVSSIKKNKRIMPFLSLWFIALLLMLNTPLYRLFWHVLPFFKLFRLPSRFIFLMLFSVSVIAGFGLDVLTRNGKHVVRCIINTLVIIFISADLYIFSHGYIPIIDTDRYFREPETLTFLKQDPDQFRTISLFPNILFHQIYEHVGGWRGDISPYLYYREYLPPGDNMMWSIPNIWGYGEVPMTRINEIHRLLDFQFVDEKTVSLSPLTSRLLSLRNTKYALSLWSLDAEGWEPVFTAENPYDLPPITIYRNAAWLPRAFIAERSMHLPQPKDMLNALKNGTIDLGTMITVEKLPHQTLKNSETSSASSPNVPGDSSVIIVESTDRKLVCEATLSKNGYLFVSDVFYPGWQVFVDGIKDEIVRADYAFRAVYLKAGNHRIRFSYRPYTFYVGAVCSILTLCIVLFLFFRFHSKRSHA